MSNIKNRILFLITVFFFTIILSGSASAVNGNWQKETVDNASGDYLTSLAIDKDGNPHIVYYDKFDGTSKYAIKNGTNWTVERIQIGNCASFKLDSKGNPHIAYFDNYHYNLMYAFKNNGSWNYMNVTNYGMFPSLVLDSNDNPSISYYKIGLEYAFKSGDHWIIENIDSNNRTGQYSSLTLDTNNDPCVSYFDSTNSVLKFAHRVNGTWNVEIVENNSNVDNWLVQILDGPSLSSNSEGDPFIAYSDRTTGFLKFAHRVNGAWDIETVDNVIYSALYISLALYPDGNPGISYCDFNSSNGSIYSGFLKYAHKTNGVWSTKILDNNLIDGLSTSLAFKEGRPCISYCYYNLNFTDGKLKYIQFVPDITSPSIISFDPLNNSLINFNKEIRVIFSEDIFAGSAWDDINILGPHGIFLMNKSIVGNVLILIPYANYSDGNYTFNIPSNALNDLASNVLVSNYTYCLSIDKTGPDVWSDIKSGGYNTNQLVTLNISEPGAIYYTLDGSNPSNVSTKYVGPIIINSSTVLRFLAVDLAGNPSIIYEESYNIDKNIPQAWANLKSGLYNSNKVIALTMSESGSIYYTLNGSTPTTNSTKYTGPLNISSSTTLRFLAVDDASNPSQVYAATYNIDKAAPKVILTYPKHMTTNVSRTSTIYVKLSENLKSSVNWSKIYIKNLKTGKILKISAYISGNVIKIKTVLNRISYTWYSVYIPAGAVKDYAGNNLGNSCSFRFKTGK